MANLRGDIIPLAVIQDKGPVVRRLLSDSLPKESVGPVHGINATVALLYSLWNLEDERWQRIRHRVQIGLIKETKEHGNTSVSMGAAVMVPKFPKTVGFLNCGTGGIKYQMYSNEGGYVHLADEFKPKGGANPNSLQIGGFKPKESVGFDAVRALLGKELASAPWKDSPDTPVYAFVTGTIRQYWEEAKDTEKQLLDSEMAKLFEGTNVRPLQAGSYYMPQDEEGTLELLGSRAMYSNLSRAGLLDEGTNVVGSFGIGRGSCQWMILKTNGQPELIGHKAGMNDVAQLAEVKTTVLNTYRDPQKLKEFLDALESTAKPVIALKSGATLALEMKEFAGLKTELTAPPQTLFPVAAPKKGQLSIIGAGLGRTGTMSLKLAIDKLGFGPTHHMTECIRNPRQSKLWLSATEGKADWDQIFENYCSQCDFPGCTFYQELLAKYPNAVVILSVRDSPDAWYNSAKDTIFKDEIEGAPLVVQIWAAVVPRVRAFTKIRTAVFRKQFGSLDCLRDAEAMKKKYLEHNEQVKKNVPKDRLLVWNVNQGWKPLCAFLQVPEPAEPFPRANDTVDFQTRFRARNRMARTMVFGALAMIGFAAFAVRKWKSSSIR